LCRPVIRHHFRKNENVISDGSQFTIIENVPENRLGLRIKQPPIISRIDVLERIKFDESWIEVVSN
jgi:hypothetical protein